MKRLFREHVEFLQECRRTVQTTGAIGPSSRFLARTLARPFERHSGPARVLEVGPGTGPVTRRILKLLKPGDHFDMVELNQTFVDVLKRRFEEDPEFQAHAGRVTIHHLPIQEFQAEAPYDYIISGLPFTNFPPDLVRDIFGVFFQLLAPDGVLTYFEYMYMRRLRQAVSVGASRSRLTQLDQVLSEHAQRHRIRRHSVLRNMPPAWVHELRHADQVAKHR